MMAALKKSSSIEGNQLSSESFSGSMYDDWQLLRTIQISEKDNIKYVLALSDNKVAVLIHYREGHRSTPRIELWNISTGNKLWTTTTGEFDNAKCSNTTNQGKLDVLPNGNLVAFLRAEHIKIIDITTGITINTFDHLPLIVHRNKSGAAVLPSGNIAFTIHSEPYRQATPSYIQIVDSKGKLVKQSRPIAGDYQLIIHGNCIYTFANNTIYQWDYLTDEYTEIFEAPHGILSPYDISALWAILPGNKPVYHPGGEWHALQIGKSSIVLQESGVIEQVIVLPDGNIATVNFVDASVKIWCPDTGKLIRKLCCDGARSESLSFTSEGQLINCVGGVIRIWGAFGALTKSVK